jgi:hypothetical protein
VIEALGAKRRAESEDAEMGADALLGTSGLLSGVARAGAWVSGTTAKQTSPE